MSGHRLDHFLHAASIAIVGASDKGLYPAGILTDLLRYGYPGRVYPVNPRRESVLGLPCYPALSALPEVPELVVIVVPRRAVLAVVDECRSLGAPAVLIVTAGFAESDEEGRLLEAQLRASLANGGPAVVGPNCAGLANLPGRVIATRLPAPPLAGGAGFVSASGALMMALQGVFADLRLGLSSLISLGNQADVTLAECLEYLAQDPETQVIGAFVEGLDDGRRFMAAAQAARRAGKPLVVVKSGRTAAGQRAAATHTAALAGSGRVFMAACRQAGAVVAQDMAELARTLHLFTAWAGRLPRGRRLALVTQSGGMGSLTADLATLAGFELPSFASKTQEALRAMPHLLAFDEFGNPADVRGAGAVGPEAAATLMPFLDDPQVDAAVLLLAKSAVAERELATAHALAELHRSGGKPFCVVWAGQRLPAVDKQSAEPLRILAEAGMPVFDQPGDCLQSLRHVVDWAVGWSQATLQAHAAPPPPRALRPAPPEAPRLLSYTESERLLAAYAIRLAPARVAASADEVADAAAALEGSVAVKLLSPAHSHKSDAGLLRLGLAEPQEAAVAARELLARAGGAPIEGILVQRMAPPGVEALVGVEMDAQFGPVLACGPGGVLVELLDEVALALGLLDDEAALALIERTRLGRLLAGVRGRPAADVRALAELLAALSRLAAESEQGAHGGALVSLDMNPVIVHESGLSPVDVRIQWRGALSVQEGGV